MLFPSRWSTPAKPKIQMKHFPLFLKIPYFYRIHVFSMWHVWQNHNIFNISDNGLTEGNVFCGQVMEVIFSERLLPIVKFILAQCKCLQVRCLYFYSYWRLMSICKNRLLFCIKEPEEINADDEVEDTCDNKEDDLGGVEEQRSVILHLLSQLKLGMDLTRVSHRINCVCRSLGQDYIYV